MRAPAIAFICAVFCGWGCRKVEPLAVVVDASLPISKPPELRTTTPSLPVPSTWPTDVPLFQQAHVTKYESSSKGDAGLVQVIEYDVRDEITTVIDFYRRTFSRATKQFDVDVAMAHAMRFVSTTETIDVTVMSAMGLTQVSITVTPS